VLLLVRPSELELIIMLNQMYCYSYESRFGLRLDLLREPREDFSVTLGLSSSRPPASDEEEVEKEERCGYFSRCLYVHSLAPLQFLIFISKACS